MNRDDAIFLATQIGIALQKYGRRLPAPVHKDYDVVVIVRYP